MKKLFKIAGLVLIAAMLASCSNASGGSSDTKSDGKKKSSTEKFTTTTVFNPNTTKVKLIAVPSSRAVEEEEVCEVDPLTKADVELGNEHEYYFTDPDGNKIADLSKGDSGEYMPVYLELNEPKDGTEYILLNQYRNKYVLEDYYRNDKNGGYDTWQLFLYEVVDKDSLDAVQYDRDTYIRAYPSANYWIDNEAYTSNMLGEKITYNASFAKQFTELSNPWTAWGWSTLNEQFDMWFCHRVVSYILHLDIEYNESVKTIEPKLASYYWYGWSTTDKAEINSDVIKEMWGPNWYWQIKTIKEDTEMGLSELFEEEIKAITTKNKDKVYIFISRFTKEKNYLVVYKNDTKLGIYEVELTGQED